jgi:hypothetical protein
MKAYGYSRRDKFTYFSGCCDLKGAKYKASRPFVDKTKRKAARRFICDEVEKEIDEK